MTAEVLAVVVMFLFSHLAFATNIILLVPDNKGPAFWSMVHQVGAAASTRDRFIRSSLLQRFEQPRLKVVSSQVWQSDRCSHWGGFLDNPDVQARLPKNHLQALLR